MGNDAGARSSLVHSVARQIQASGDAFANAETKNADLLRYLAYYAPHCVAEKG
jgi:hypothetical protein